MNIRRIKALRNFIAKLPPRAVYMPDYIACDRPSETIRQAASHTCGTRACIAGWAVLKFHKDRKATIRNGDFIDGAASSRRISYIAAELLCLDEDEAAMLFLGHWSTTTKGRYEMTKRDVLRELDHIIKTGEI